jgi:hypothetical protein
MSILFAAAARPQPSLLDQTQSIAISKPYQGIVTALEAFQVRAMVLSEALYRSDTLWIEYYYTPGRQNKRLAFVFSSLGSKILIKR